MCRMSTKHERNHIAQRRSCSDGPVRGGERARATELRSPVSVWISTHNHAFAVPQLVSERQIAEFSHAREHPGKPG